MAQFKLKISGTVSELALIGAALFDAGLADAAPADGPKVAAHNAGFDIDALRRVVEKTADMAPSIVEQVHREVAAEAAAEAPAETVKKSRTRKATVVDTPAEASFSEQIKSVVAEETAADPTSPSAPALPDATSSEPTASSAGETTEPEGGYVKACQALVNELIKKHPTAELLGLLEPFGAKSVSKIAETHPQNMPDVYAKLVEKNGGPL